MNYRSVIEEQIEVLKKLQDKLSNNTNFTNEICLVAKTIADLTKAANEIPPSLKKLT